MENGTTVRVERVQAGQPRPYADSLYDARLRLMSTFAGTTGPWYPPEGTVRALAKVLVHPFEHDEADRSRLWYAPYLKACEQEEPGCWRVLIVRPYDD